MSSVSPTSKTNANEHIEMPGIITAGLLAIIIVATLIGGIAGMALHGTFEPATVAVLAGLIGTVAAGVAHNTLLRIWSNAGAEYVGAPVSVIISASVASLAGSLAAHEMVSAVGPSGRASRGCWPVCCQPDCWLC